MKKTVYIHIGTHKTGTTAIQKFSAQHAKELGELGVLYPNISRPSKESINAGHHLLPWYLLGHPVPDIYYGGYADKKEMLFISLIAAIKSSKHGSIVISSEEFDRLNEEQIKRLKSYFEEVDVKIIIYLRRKDSFLETMYQTNVVHGSESRPIHEAMKNMGIPLDYFTFVRKWQDTFGVENVHIHFYCKNTLKSNDIVIDFYDRLGLNVEDDVKNFGMKGMNASIPLQYVTVIANLKRNGAPNHVLDLLKRIAKKIGDTADKNYHFLSVKERIKLANSGLEEIEKLNLVLPDKECFSLSSLELNDDNAGSFALKKVFEDFENYIDNVENN